MFFDSEKSAKRHLFGHDAVDDQELRLRMAYLHRLLERYLAQKEIEADDTNLRLHLAAGYRKRGLAAPFERVRRGLEKSMGERRLRDAKHYESQFRLYWEAHQLAHDRNPTEFEHLQTASGAADIAFLTLKLRLICLQAAHSSLYAGGQAVPWETEVVAFATQHLAQTHPAIETYSHCYRMMRHPEEETYKNSLEKPYRESAYHFNLARLEFCKKNYGAVLDLLQKANYRDVLVNLAIKTLLLKTYYELDEYNLLESHLHAMQNYIHRKRILGYHRANYLNIIRYTGKLLALRVHKSASSHQDRRTAAGKRVVFRTFGIRPGGQESACPTPPFPLKSRNRCWKR